MSIAVMDVPSFESELDFAKVAGFVSRLGQVTHREHGSTQKVLSNRKKSRNNCN